MLGNVDDCMPLFGGCSPFGVVLAHDVRTCFPSLIQAGTQMATNSITSHTCAVYRTLIKVTALFNAIFEMNSRLNAE